MSSGESKTAIGSQALTRQDCLLALQNYAARSGGTFGHLRCRLIECCIQGGDQTFELERVENFTVYRVELQTKLERRINLPSEEEMSMAKARSLREPVENASQDFHVAEVSQDSTRTCSQCDGLRREICGECRGSSVLNCDCWFDSDQPPGPYESIYGKAPCDKCGSIYSCQNCKDNGFVKCGCCAGTGKTVLVRMIRMMRDDLKDRKFLELPDGLEASLLDEAGGYEEDTAKTIPAVAKAAQELQRLHAWRAAKLSHGPARVTHQRCVTHRVPVAKVSYALLSDDRERQRSGICWILGRAGFCHCPKGFPWNAVRHTG